MDSDPPLNKIIPVHIVYTMPTRYDLEHERQILDDVYVRYTTCGQLSGERGNLRILANRFKPQTTVKARCCRRCSLPGPQLIKLFLLLFNSFKYGGCISFGTVLNCCKISKSSFLATTLRVQGLAFPFSRQTLVVATDLYTNIYTHIYHRIPIYQYIYQHIYHNTRFNVFMF